MEQEHPPQAQAISLGEILRTSLAAPGTSRKFAGLQSSRDYT